MTVYKVRKTYNWNTFMPAGLGGNRRQTSFVPLSRHQKARLAKAHRKRAYKQSKGVFK